MFLVTGATGNVGSEVVRALREAGAPVRAFVRDRERARSLLGDDAEVAVGDFADRGSLDRALDGADGVFLTSANGHEEVAHEAAVIDAAAAAGVPWLVKLSAFHPEVGSHVPGSDWHGRIEAHLRASRVPHVVLRSNFLMTNLLASAAAVAASGTLIAPAGASRISMIDPRDVAAVAARLLTEPAHAGEALALTGPEAVTHEQVAAALARAAGRPVTYVDVPPAGAREALTAGGAPDWLVAQVLGVFELAAAGRLAPVTGTVREIAGRDPSTIGGWAERHAEAFRAAEPAHA